MDGFLPTSVWDFSSFGVDVVLIIIGDLRGKDFIGLRKRGNVRSFAEIRDSTLEIIEFFLDFALRLGLSFSSELERDSQRDQGALELGMRFRLRIEDRVVIGVIGQGAAVSF